MKIVIKIIALTMLPLALFGGATQSTPIFTYNLQLAGYDYDQYDQKGPLDCAEFKKVFESFDWLEEIRKIEAIKKGCSTTVSVKNQQDQTELWVSAAGAAEDGSLLFFIGYVYKKDVEGNSFKEKRWLEIYASEGAQPVYENFELFFSNQPDKLLNNLRRLELYTEMEPQK
jgi:hypothetical protein